MDKQVQADDWLTPTGKARWGAPLSVRLRRVTQRASGCLEWSGYINACGYGVCAFEGKLHRTHRLAWILAHGSIPLGTCVLHRCDNPACLRIDHLFLGTHADNMRDREQKGRSNHKPHPMPVMRGLMNPRAKLSDEQVSEIRRKAAGGTKSRILSNEYGVTTAHVRALARGKARPAKESA